MHISDPSGILESIRKEDKKALVEIYKTCFPQVRHYITTNSGNLFDAEDIFQDALVLVYLKIKNNTLSLSSSFSTYFNSVIRFLWLKELEKKRKYFSKGLEKSEFQPSDEDFLEEYYTMEKRKLILFHFEELSDECRKIIDLHVKGAPVSRIKSLMGYSSEQYTLNRKTACKERLIRAIWNNPKFKELKNESYRQNSKVPRW